MPDLDYRAFDALTFDCYGPSSTGRPDPAGIRATLDPRRPAAR
jgi:hypothetical protein